MNMKISAKDKKLLVLLLIIVIAALIFMFGIKPLSDDIAEKQEKLDGLKKTDSEYQTQMSGSGMIYTEITTQEELLENSNRQIPPVRYEIEVGPEIKSKVINIMDRIGGKYQNTGAIVPIRGTEAVVLETNSDGGSKKETVSLGYWSASVHFECVGRDMINNFISEIQKDNEWNVIGVTARFDETLGSKGMWSVDATVALYSAFETDKK